LKEGEGGSKALRAGDFPDVTREHAIAVLDLTKSGIG